MKDFPIRGFNPCESLLRHTPEQLTRFLRRMKEFDFNSVIIHSDYGWRRYRELIERECAACGVEITLMVFGPRTFFSLADWKSSWFAKDESGNPFTRRPECETHPCAAEADAVAGFQEGAEKYLASLPDSIKRLHMRAGDGLMFCRCPKCREIPEHEQYLPFIEAFVRAAKKVRPDLKLETDLYIRRYSIPRRHEVFGELDRVMFDTFYRHPFFPIGSTCDRCNAFAMQYAAPAGYADAVTPNEYYLKRLKQWNSFYPGKLYIHENVMCQGYWGCPQYNTGVYLRDQQLYRELGLGGVCYEAYEPGFAAFAKSFAALAAGKELEEAGELEKILPSTDLKVFCTDPEFPFERYLDPFAARIARNLATFLARGVSAKFFREVVEFQWSNEDILDPLLVSYAAARSGWLKGSIVFDELSEPAQELISRRKLWDFMEDIPVDSDPRAVCRELIMELYNKVRDNI
ncbi:MAG: hypothetical protein IJC27_06595 [Lentisphaeria bacterium]|nr:hypothetical protein [Lentisphaeria bacterium]